MRWLAVLAGAASWLATSTALAGSFELSWTAPRECPKAAFVEAEVARVVGRPWLELSAEWRTARAEVSAGQGGYRVRVAVVTRAGLERTRSIVAPSCTEAAEAAVAILTAGMAPAQATEARTAAALDANAATSTAAADTDGAARASGVASGVDTPPPAEDAAASGTPAQPLLAAHVGVDIGSLAAVAPFAQLSGGLAWGRFSALLSAGATGSVVGELDATSAGAQMSLLLGGAAGCWRVTATNPSLAGCAGIELGRLSARGIGTVDGRSGHVFWSAGLARAALDWNIGSISVVSLGATAVLPFRHLRVVSSPEEVHRTPSVALRPWLGLGLRFE